MMWMRLLFWCNQLWIACIMTILFAIVRQVFIRLYGCLIKLGKWTKLRNNLFSLSTESFCDDKHQMVAQVNDKYRTWLKLWAHCEVKLWVSVVSSLDFHFNDRIFHKAMKISVIIVYCLLMFVKCPSFMGNSYLPWRRNWEYYLINLVGCHSCHC